MNRLGMLVDLSHVAPTTMRDALAHPRAGDLLALLCARGLPTIPRNVPDDVLAALPANGGVCMVTFVPEFVSQAVADWDGASTPTCAAAGLDPPDLEARRAVPPDVGSRRPRRAPRWPTSPPTSSTCARWRASTTSASAATSTARTRLRPGWKTSRLPALFAALLDRGWSEADCAKLAGRNALRVLRAADDA